VLSLMVICISDRTSQLFLAPVAKSQFNMTSFMGVHKLTSETGDKYGNFYVGDLSGAVRYSTAQGDASSCN
jgi:hypothetical protein